MNTMPYGRPSPSIESNSSDLQNNDSSVSEKGDSSESIMSKPMIKFVKATNSPTEVKISKVETVRKLFVKYAEMYRNTTKSPKFRGNQRNWNNLKTRQLGKDFVMKNKACFKCGQFDHLAYDCGVWEKQGKTWPKNNNTHKRNKGKVVKASACWIWRIKQNATDKGKITGKEIIKTGKLKFENVYFVKDLKYNLFSVSQICDNKNSVLFTDSECIVLGRDVKLRDDTNVLLRTPRQHNMYSIDLNNIVPYKDLTCLVAKASADESVLWHKRLGHLNFKTMNKLVRHNLIKRELNNAITPQQNGVAERRNKTLIKAAETMLADAKLPGTTSTNFLGIKDAASQDVKKDVSSLRYIALLNWFHEAHLESSTCNAQDACNADAPESNGNSNPTATSTNPPADYMETLTVESPIPTVSSPVLTACLDDSPEPSSNTRLNSKRVTSQDDTPSLDNILTLSNRFEDILRVTTNTGDINGVEANLGNMENNISASPTPTFRIHKDHLKSQIIGPVDTPNVWSLVDCPKGVRPIGIKWVLKNKKDERGIVTRNKARLMAQGHTQEEGINYEEVFTPVARIEAIRLFLAYASSIGFIVYQMDVKSAFLYGTIDEEVYVMQPPGFQDPEFPARKKDGIFLSQDKYVGDILKKFRYSDVRSANTPIDKENPWGKDGTGKDVDLHLYRFMIGSLMYLTVSRPDIMFAVYAYDRHQVTPKEYHLHAVKRIFRYLILTLNTNMIESRNKEKSNRLKKSWQTKEACKKLDSSL
nr:ribonuclease H-like domain-containing protein [Tanacetum cinerariifolium]